MISSTTPAKSTPIINIIYDEKVPRVSLVELAISVVKLFGNVIKVNIFLSRHEHI